MITKLTVSNWKSYSEATLYIDPLTFLIGTNASGKSNLLDAFVCLSELASGRQVSDVFGSIRGGADWLIRKGQRVAKLSVVEEQEEGEDVVTYEVEFMRRDEGISISREKLMVSDKVLFEVALPEETSPVTVGSFYTGKRGDRVKIEFGRSVSVLSQIETLSEYRVVREAASKVVRDLRGVFMLNPIPNNMRGYTPLSRALRQDASNVAGVLAGMEEGRRKEVEGVLTSYLRKLPERDINKVWTERVGVFGADAMLYCEEQWSTEENNVVDARGMSDGTLRFLAIVVALLTINPESLLIVEEVDNGLHPSRIVELIQMLRTIGAERRVDVICTTHNPVVMDGLGVEMIPFIACTDRDGDGASVVRLVEDKENLAKMLSMDSIGGLMVKDML